MDPILDAFRAYFDEHELPYEEAEGSAILRLWFRGHHGEWICLAQSRLEQQQAVFYSRASVPVPEDRRLAVAEFVCRANYGMIVGNFEIDLDDGEVRYKTSVDIEGVTATRQLIQNLVAPNVITMDRYLPGLLSVAFGGKHPAEAIAEIEAHRTPIGEA